MRQVRRKKNLLGRKKISVWVLVFSIAVLLPVIAWAETENMDNWERFVSQKYIYSLVAADGYLWAGIDGGIKVFQAENPELQRFYHKLNSNLGANMVFAVAADAQGGLWFGTEMGAVYLAADGSWSTLTKENTPFAVNSVTAIAPDAIGGIWFGTWGGGAYYLDRDNNWQSYTTINSRLPGNRIYVIATTDIGGVWFGTDSRGAAYMSSTGGWEIYQMSNSGLPANDVLDIAIDSGAKVWFGTYQGVGFINDQGEWQVFNTKNSKLPDNTVNALALGGDGSLWIGTGKGLARLTAGGDMLVYPGAGNQLTGQIIKSVAVDEVGRVWLGTWGNGIGVLDLTGTPDGAKITPARGEVYNSRWVDSQVSLSLPGRIMLPANSVNYILPLYQEDELERVWFGTDLGASVLHANSNTWELYNVAQGNMKSNQVRSIVEAGSGRLVFAFAESGIGILSPQGEWQYYTEANSRLPSNTVTGAAADNLGGLWITTGDAGIAYLDQQGNWTVYNRENEQLPGDAINFVYLDQAGTPWFGTWGSGLLKFAGKENWEIISKANSGLPVNDVVSMAVDRQGNTWLATWGGGVVRISEAAGWRVFNTANSSLPSNVIKAVTVDNRGWVWAATSAGAAYFSGESWQLLTAGETAIPANNLQVITADKLGNVWFATTESGAAVFNPSGLPGGLKGLGDLIERPAEIAVYLKDRYIISDVPPVLENGRTLVPMRFIFEALGAEIEWLPETRQVKANMDGKVIELAIDNVNAHLNGELITLEVPARLINDRTLVPLRFVGESLGLKVEWEPVVRAVILTEAGDDDDR